MEILETTWIEEFELLDGFYSESDIQDYFKYFNKKHKALAAEKPIVQIYINKIQKRITVKININSLQYF